jgi:hypothetical protein
LVVSQLISFSFFVCFLEGFQMLRFVLSVALALVGSVASAQTPFPARFVESGQTVTVPKGNYTMSQQVVIRAGGTLILEAGVNVRVSNLGLPMQIYGALIVNGTASDPVVVGPDALGVCGTLQTYASPASRPSIQATYLDWTTTRNSNALFLSACDFAISNSKITSKATAAANRTCVAAVGGSVGSLFNCMLDGANDLIAKPSVGVAIGNGTSQSDAVELMETLIINTTDPLKIRKQFALVSGSIE